MQLREPTAETTSQERRPPRRLGRTAGLCAGLATGALALAACTSSPAGSSRGTTTTVTPTGPTASPRGITPTKARSIVTAVMTTNNTANEKYDSPLLATYETGSAFALDDATYHQDRLAVAAHDPIGSYEPFTVNVRQVAVARGGGGGAVRFLAVGLQHGEGKQAAKQPSCTTFLQFAPSSGGHWRIALEPGAPAADLPKLALDRSGFAASVPTAALTAADALPDKAAHALFVEETTGALGPFSQGDFTQSCGTVPNPRADLITAEDSGDAARDLFSAVTPADTSAFRLADGGTLVMFTLRFEDELIAGSSGGIDWSHAASRKSPAEPWQYLLAAGTYSQVVEKGEAQLVAVLAPNDKSYKVIGGYSGIISISGTKSTRTGTSIPRGTLTDQLVRR